MTDLSGTSNFTTADTDAFWSDKRTGTVCRAIGLGVLASCQVILRNALRGPWNSYAGTVTTRPDIDGNWGPVTNQALYAYAVMRSAPIAARDQLKTDGQAKKITRNSIQMLVWLTYYQPRIIDLDIEGRPEKRTQDPILGLASFDQVLIPEDVIPFKWLSRPAVPDDLGVLGARLPRCTVATGPGIGSNPGIPGVPLPVPLPNAPPTPPVTPPSSGSGWGWFLGAIALGIGISRSRRRRR